MWYCKDEWPDVQGSGAVQSQVQELGLPAVRVPVDVVMIQVMCRSVAGPDL